MMTVHEVSRLTGVSIRTLQYYDRIGLLPPAGYTEAGYRLYDEASLDRLGQILLFRELEFPLADIRSILESPDFDRDRALEQQIALLTVKKEHIEDVIRLASELRSKGAKTMDFQAFDKKKQEEYAARAKAEWGHTPEYREQEKKRAGKTDADNAADASALMSIFARLGEYKSEYPGSKAVQALIHELQTFISANFYTCTKPVLMGLGSMYAAGGEFTENIDRAGGAGTAVFTEKAISIYCAD